MQYCFILTGLDFDDISWIDKAGTILRRNLKFNIGPYRLPSDNVEPQTLIIIITVYLMKKKYQIIITNQIFTFLVSQSMNDCKFVNFYNVILTINICNWN